MVSVIVPIYNAKMYMGSCIESILQQSYKEFELILVNDGSHDDSGSICDEYAEKDTRIRVIHNTNHGVSFSRNCGLEIAKGEYIAFCDADDLYAEDYLQEMVDAIVKNHCDIAICNYSYLKAKLGNPVSSRKTGYIKLENIYQGMFIDNTIGGFVWNKIFRREVLRELKFNINMQICEDTFFVCQALNNASKVYFIEKSLYQYRIHESNTVRQVENMINKNNDLKYGEVFDELIQNDIIPNQYIHYVRVGESILAIDVKCNYLNNIVLKNKMVIRNINHRIFKNIKYLLFCRCISFKKKLVYISNAMFNVRKLKLFFLRKA